MPVAEAARPTSRLGRAQVVTRTEDWWHHKVPVVLAFGYVVFLGPSGVPVIDAADAALALLAFITSIIGVAGLGHMVNDLFDAEQDRRVGRMRAAANLGPRRRAALLGGLAVIAVVPWLLLPSSPAVWILLGLELALLVGYSVPPVRAKERGALALVFDASYAYVVPIALTFAAFGQQDVGSVDDLTPLVVTSMAWAFVTGLRGIAFHQIDDLDDDRVAGTRTWAVRLGRERALRRVTPVALVEPVLFGAVVLTLTERVPLLPLWMVLVVGWRSFQLRFLAGYESSIQHLDAEQRLRRLGFEILNDVYERWLPILVLLTLAVRSPGYWFLVIAHTLVFDNGIVGFVSRDLKQLPSFRYTWAYWSTYWRGRFRGWRARGGRVLRPATPRSSAEAGRWVFVVCGPAEHVETLHTALRWLQPRTNQEILVVTDPARNEVPVRHDGVIEVDTPEDLDHKAASIWIKTSLHRHIPLDRRACYLDTDVIATRADVDEVFDRAVGPITFALDRMIRENNVDRFSPAAMTCDDSGVGETSSCHHLREALADKWDLHPPGDWMNWNGGVFLFDAESSAFLDEWHEKSLAAFEDPRFTIRDQHALIATVWSRGLQDQPCLPSAFNTIVDLGSNDITWWGGSCYAVHPDERPEEARFLHLYSNDLHEPGFTMGSDVEEVVLRQMARRAASEVREVGDEVREVADAVREGVTVSVRGVGTAARAVGRAVWGVLRVAGRRMGRGLMWFLLELVHRPPQVWWAIMRAVVIPVVNVLRRAGRSVDRRFQVLTGRVPSPGGRRDALRFPKGWRDRPQRTAEVEVYYDDWHERYVAGFGEVWQTFRSADPAVFLLELADLAGLEAGMRVLDAGCGVGGPAMLYAEKVGVEVDGVTVSQAQVDDGRRRVEERGLADRVRIVKGDFQRLEEVYAEGTFDVVYFLEAFCHSDEPEVVLGSVARVLKPGGSVFIKDLFRNRGSSPEEEADIAVAVRNTETHCHLNVWPRQRVLDALAATGFEIELDQPFELFADFDYDTGNDFVNDNGVDIFEGRPSTYLEHAAIRARTP